MQGRSLAGAEQEYGRTEDGAGKEQDSSKVRAGQ